jgi:hypothetical protein
MFVPKIGYFLVYLPTCCHNMPIMLVLSYKSMQRSPKLSSKQDKNARIEIPTRSRMTKPKSLTLACVFKTISDPISLELFKSISVEGSDSSVLRSKTSLSLRQYYSRISNFTRNGMLKRKSGKNYRTTFGKVLYHVLLTIENAFTDYYKLRVIDSIGLYHDIPQEEHKKIVDNLITDPDIKQFLLTRS